MGHAIKVFSGLPALPVSEYEPKPKPRKCEARLSTPAKVDPDNVTEVRFIWNKLIRQTQAFEGSLDFVWERCGID